MAGEALPSPEVMRVVLGEVLAGLDPTSMRRRTLYRKLEEHLGLSEGALHIRRGEINAFVEFFFANDVDKAIIPEMSVGESASSLQRSRQQRQVAPTEVIPQSYLRSIRDDVEWDELPSSFRWAYEFD